MAKEFDIPSMVSVDRNLEQMSLYRRVGVNLLENASRLIAGHLSPSVERPCNVDHMSTVSR